MSPINEEDIHEIPAYPDEWTAEQRVSCYWHALNFTNMPGTTQGWYAVAKSLEREQGRRLAAVKAQEDKQ